MQTFQLTDIEDRTLAMAEGEYVHLHIARPVLGTYYERNVGFGELCAIVGRLSNLGLLTWRIRERGRSYFRKHAQTSSMRSCAAVFRASEAGVAYLRQPRRVPNR